MGQPFERLADFERQTGLLWISDKTGRGGRGTRMIVLPPSALRQIDHWHDHLTRLAARLNWRDRSLVTDRIAPALSLASDARPLFFLLGPDGRPRELSADEQEAAFRSVLPTPLNWSRHVLRSALIGQVPGPALDAWLGHAHQGEDTQFYEGLRNGVAPACALTAKGQSACAGAAGGWVPREWVSP